MLLINKNCFFSILPHNLDLFVEVLLCFRLSFFKKHFINIVVIRIVYISSSSRIRIHS